MAEQHDGSERWDWDWWDNSPNGPTYGVRCREQVICYTNRFKAGFERAKHIAEVHNERISQKTASRSES